MLRIKLCGFTRPEDVDAAVALGVDLIGLNLARGPRRIPLDRAAALARRVPPGATAVALFQNASESDILEALRVGRFAAVQLHGDEPPELAERLRARVPVIRACAPRNVATLDAAGAYPCDALLLDAPGGGSGQGWDHSLLDGRAIGRPWFLAGGLRPANVRAAVARTRPWGVDAASGVESAPGVKCPALMAAFVAACRA